MTAEQRFRLQAADAYCQALLHHHENFRVASRLSPRRLRRDLARIYAFCRFTDDLGDETADRQLAVRRLHAWRAEVGALFSGIQMDHPVLLALAETVEAHQLQAQPFLDLIEANVQDQHTTRYEDWPALRGYCRLSAAPVGRMVLQLFRIDGARAVSLSDDVCIGLQLANFAQDVSVDARRGRTYLLQGDLRAGGETGAVRAVCERARGLLASGRELESLVPARLRAQLALYRLGGNAILDAIARSAYMTHSHRPVVTGIARAGILARTLRDTALRPAAAPAEAAVPDA